MKITVPLHVSIINRLFSVYSGVIGKEITPHDLRHFFCFCVLSKGLSISEVANQAGHSNVHTALLYTNPSKNELMEKWRK